ncbi:hypothetical protein G7054_g5559 [Neopestalotiopsis clavispora]|nr:hypothetical protein G7054_g5559 [Neopestalotiopsis clavispora]
MAEAIAALAFAGNIVQFLEFGAKFVLKADQIVKAGSSSLDDLQELRHITHYLQPLLQHLNTDDSEHSSQSLQTQETILQQLKADSRYSSPKPRLQGRPGLEDDLGDAPGSIMLQYIRSTLESGLADEQMIKTEEDVHQLLFQRGDYVDDDNNVVQKRPRIEMKHTRREKIEAHIISSLRYSQINDRETSISEAYRETFQWMFKDSPLDRKDTKFREWLESGDRLYWITGKAGSGKSTLMKYISNFDGTSDGSLECKEHLQKWAGGEDRLVVASFYFWASGSSIEASQHGLYRSLLYQILGKHPYLLPQITPRTWEALSTFGLMRNIEKEKSLDQILLSAVQELVERRNKKICLFIDGLDEYQGDHEKLIVTLRSCLILPNVKICVSSRPWIVFEDNFKTAPSLMVQEFTYPDIHHFVTSRFNENDGFARLQMRDPDYAKTLITNIIDKASGVFLWITLVVASLLAGVTNDDRMSDLQRRLDLLPPDLENLYDAILQTLDPFYFGHASQYFQLLEASNNGPDALLYSFVDEESLDFALTLPIRAFTEEEIRFRRDTVKRRLNSRCKGLLEVGPQGRVQFLHRSVRDYINASEVRLRIDRAVEKDFDCHLQLCSANLAMVKIMGVGSRYEQNCCAEECLMMAANVKLEISKMISILDDLDRTLIEVLDSHDLRAFYRSMPLGSKDDRHKFAGALGTSFLATTVRFSVVDYVRARAEAGCMAADDNEEHDNIGIVPVDTVLEPKKSRFKRLMQKSRFLTPSESQRTSTRRKGTWPLLLDANVCRPISLPMFQCLLKLGADPNLVWHQTGKTPWTEMLAHMSSRVVAEGYAISHMAREWEQWVPILVLFMDHGAYKDNSLSQTSMADKYGPGLRIRPLALTQNIQSLVDGLKWHLHSQSLMLQML